MEVNSVESSMTSSHVAGILRSLGFLTAELDSDGHTLWSDDGWTALVGTAGSAELTDVPGRALAPQRFAPTLSDESSTEDPPITTQLVPVYRNGATEVLEIVSMATERNDGSVLLAGRDAPGRLADNLARGFRVAFTESVEMAIIGIRLDGTIIYWNSGAMTLYDLKPGQAIGQNFSVLVPDDQRLAVDAALSNVFGGEKIDHLDTCARRTTGSTLEVDMSMMPALDPAGEVAGAIVIVRDVSTERSLDRRSRIHSGIAEQSPIGLLLWRERVSDGQLELNGVNSAARRLTCVDESDFGATPEQLSSKFAPLAAFVWPPIAHAEDGRTHYGRHHVSDSRGAKVTVEMHAFALAESNVALSITDITRQAAAEHERRRLLDRVARAEDAGRQKIAEALHDDTIQVLAAVNMELGALRRTTTDTEVVSRVTQIEAQVRHASHALRSLVFELYPPDLDSGGIAAGLRALMARMFDDGTETVVINELQRTIGPEIRMTAYRILQEGLANTRRHAGATHVSVRLFHEEDDLVAVLMDNGIGFDPSRVHHRPGHLGLATMHERAESRFGSVEVRAHRPHGTEVWVRIPDPLDRFTAGDG